MVYSWYGHDPVSLMYCDGLSITDNLSCCTKVYDTNRPTILTVIATSAVIIQVFLTFIRAQLRYLYIFRVGYK